jgi:hypothetical protein
MSDGTVHAAVTDAVGRVCVPAGEGRSAVYEGAETCVESVIFDAAFANQPQGVTNPS